MERRKRARPGSRRGEAANALMVEGMFIALLLVVSLSVLQMGPALPSGTAERPLLERDASDVLAHFATAKDPTGAYARLLDRAVAEALQGNATQFESTLRLVLPTGAPFNVLLDNGEGQLRLRWAREPAGETVSAQRPWSPSWEAVVAAPTLSLVDGAKLPLEVQAVPLHRALGLLDQPGVGAEVVLERGDGIQSNRSAFAPLINGTSGLPGVRIAFLDDAGTPVDVVRPAAGNDSLFVRVAETQGREVPAGTVLEVRVPPGFTSGLLPASLNAGWTSLTLDGNATFGWVVQAKLESALSSASKVLRFNMTRPAWGKVHAFEATLEGGALGRFGGALVASGSSARTGPGTLVPQPQLNLPRGAPWSAAAPAGLVVAHDADTGTTWNLTAVRLHLMGGVQASVFTGTSPASGWVRQGDWLNWTGFQALAAGDALAFAFDLQAGAPASLDSGAKAGPSMVLGDGSNVTLGSQRAPGVFVGRAEARNATIAGYPTTAGAATATLEAKHQGATLGGKVAYDVSTADILGASASDLGRGMAGSWLTAPTPGRVALGESITVRWNLTELTLALGLTGSSFQCYKDSAGATQLVADRAACDAVSTLDWQYTHGAPAVQLRLFHPSPVGKSGTAWPVAVTNGSLATAGEATVTLPVESLLGTHALALEADLPLEHRGGSELTQRVTMLAALDVHRAGQAPPPGPLYDVVVQAWMPDWG